MHSPARFSCRRLPAILGLLALVCGFGTATARGQVNPWVEIVRPTFERHCTKCHGAEDKVKGKVNLQDLTSADHLAADLDLVDDLLDNTIFTYGSGLGDGATHQYNDLPIIVAGSGGGKLATGSHLSCPDGTPLANLWLTQARAFGLARERFAESTGTLPQLHA